MGGFQSSQKSYGSVQDVARNGNFYQETVHSWSKPDSSTFGVSLNQYSFNSGVLCYCLGFRVLGIGV